MIPVIQFDPASLSIWYDAHLLAKCRGADDLRNAIELAYEGRDNELRSSIAAIKDSRVQIRAAHWASSIWHEKRHFLDFLITSYGALRIRQFFEIYRNLSAVFHKDTSAKRILLPLDSNLDPLKREIFGIGDVDPGVLQLAESIEKRKSMLADDRRSIPFKGLGHIELGGEAILEAIAYHTQITKVHAVFGSEMSRAIQQDQPPGQSIGSKYRWAYELLFEAGLLAAHQEGDRMWIEDEPFLPLLYGALAGRFWKQEQTRSEWSSSYLPAERLSGLIIKLRETVPNFKALKSLDAWQAVNQAATSIFGRSVLEETEIDIEFEGKYIKLLSDRDDVNNAASPMHAYQEYHALRETMFAKLKNQPATVLTCSGFADDLVGKLRPMVVVAASAGEIGVPPEGFKSLISYAHPEEDYDKVPEARWWWAATRKPALKPREGLYELKAHSTWCNIVSDYAPMAKLAAAGLRCRVMLGPEIISIKSRMEHAFGLKLVIDGLYAPEMHANDISYWYYITGHDRVRCDLSFDFIQSPEGRMLDPWELRLRPKLNEALMVSMGGSAGFIRLAMWRDWSPWILGERGGDLFQRYPRDAEALTYHLSGDLA